ncbi:MAG: hypothetical protein ACYDA4_04215 [Ignavibacteriaceae bacterium]
MALFEVELVSQWLRQQLQKPVSHHFKILSIFRFFSLIQSKENQSKYISYYLQFKDDIFSIILNDGLDYSTPDELDKLSAIVEKIISFSPLVDKSEKEKLFNRIENAKMRMKNILNEESSNVNGYISGYSFSVNQVLIEDDQNAKLNSGIIEKLSIAILENGISEMKDSISFENNYDDKKNDLPGLLMTIMKLAKDDAEKLSNQNKTYKFTFSFEKKDYLYCGNSMELGMAVLIYNSILIKQMYKYYFKFKDDVAFGCALDDSGFLIPLELEPLHLKLKTVFYSKYKKLVLPEENIIDARNLLAQLTDIYPNRNLELIPVKHYLTLFKNLDVVEICKLKLKDKVRIHYNQYHIIANSVLSLLILIVLAFLLVKVIIPNLDHNPVYTELRNDRFVACNKYGKTVWESEILSNEDLAAYKSLNYKAKRILLSDLNNDGINEILLLLDNEKEKLSKRTIFCYNYDGSIKWETVIPTHDSLYGNVYCSNDIATNIIYVLNKEKAIFIDFRVCALFPTFIDKINFEGKIISEFYNPGAIGQFIGTKDIDGNDELICGGINNDIDKSGALIVFDPKFIKGCAPGYRMPKNKSIGLMKYYLLFPKTDVGRFTNHGSSEIELIELHDNRIIVYVKEMDIFTDLENHQQKQEYGTIYTLDKSYNILHVETSSEFDAKYQQLVEEGKLKPVKDWVKYKEKLASRVRWWNGDKFVNHPAINKYYLLAKAKKNQASAMN